MPTCWAPGCKSGYPGQKGTKRHFFKVPAGRLELWQRHIPRDGVLSIKNSLCDLHFEDRFIFKTYVHVINGERVETAQRSKVKGQGVRLLIGQW